MSQQGSLTPRSELVSVVAWMEIFAAGFGLLAGLFQLAFISVARLYDSAPLSPQASSQLTVIVGVAIVILLASVVVLLAGIGLRRRYNWARRLTVGLCYLGCVLLVVMFTFQWMAINMWINEPSSYANPQMFSMLGLVIKAFIASFLLIGLAMFLWVANRLNGSKIVAEFLPVPPVVNAPTEPQAPSQEL